MAVWTVAVVGAGPAGAAAALSALQHQPQARVLLLDRFDFPRDKACGDAIVPHALQVLDGLGLEDVTHEYKPVTKLSMATRQIGACRELVHPFKVVPRQEFDARLVAAARARGAVFRRLAVKTVRQDRGAVILNEEIVAGAVVAADGAESTVRRQLGNDLNGNGHVGLAIRGYANSTSSLARLVARGHDWPAYAWEFPMGDGRSNVGYGQVIRRGVEVTKLSLLHQLEELIPGGQHDAHGWRAARVPFSTQRPQQPDGRVILAGDAASLVNPMSGEGISYAVLSGALAGQAALYGASAGAMYRRWLKSAFGRNIRHTTLVATAGALGSMASLGVRMVALDPAFFDNQVEVSIGAGAYRPAVAARALLRALTASR